MKKLFGMLSSAFVAVCIGTAVSVAIFLGVLWLKGGLAGDRLMGMLAAMQGVDVTSLAAKAAEAPEANDAQPSFAQVLEKRALAGLDLDLRESAIDKALGDLRNLESITKTERERLDLWKQSFDQRLANLETQATDTALRDVQTTLEVMAPKQAKEQILIMLDNPGQSDVDQPMRDVVTILKTMPIEKRKKILAEFKTPDEEEKLAEILHEIRLGTPDSDLLRATREQLQQQNNQKR